MATDLTIKQIMDMRKDLEKRLKIDISQFESDTGVVIEDVRLHRYVELGKVYDALSHVELTAKLTR